jgi:hypothetical protein
MDKAAFEKLPKWKKVCAYVSMCLCVYMFRYVHKTHMHKTHRHIRHMMRIKPSPSTTHNTLTYLTPSYCFYCYTTHYALCIKPPPTVLCTTHYTLYIQHTILYNTHYVLYIYRTLPRRRSASSKLINRKSAWHRGLESRGRRGRRAGGVEWVEGVESIGRRGRRGRDNLTISMDLWPIW